MVKRDIYQPKCCFLEIYINQEQVPTTWNQWISRPLSMSFNHIIFKTIHSYLIFLRASSIMTWITATTTAGVVTFKPPSKAGQGKWQGQRASGQTQVLIARLSGYANIARPDANTGIFASTLQIHDIPLQKLPFLEPWKYLPQNEEKCSVSVLR